MQYESERIKNVLLYGLVVVVSGCILANILIRLGRDVSLFYVPYSDYTSVASLPVKETFFYVLLQRGKQLILFYLLVKVLPPELIFRTIITVFLFVFGVSVSCQMYLLGMQGVVWLLLCLFPHYLIYVWLLYHVYRHQNLTGDSKQSMLSAGLIAAYFIVGVLTESIVSRIFLKNFLQYIDL